MHFQAPALLLWSLALVPVVALFLFRRRPRRVPVTTLAFFKSLSKSYQESAWLRRLKRLLAFLLACLTVLAGVGALAHLIVAPASGSLHSIVILVDASASMAATDAEGRTRLDEARELIDPLVAGVSPATRILVMSYDRRPQILLPHSLDRRAVRRALESIATRPVAGDPEKALELARRLAAVRAPAAVWHVTDRAGASASSQSDDVTVETFNVGIPNPVNAGITAFELRHLPLENGRLEAFVEVSAAAEEPLDVTLEMSVDGTLVALRELTIGVADEATETTNRARLLLPIEGRTGETLSLAVRAEGDALALDNALYARIPEFRAIRAVWVRPDPDPFTRLALAAISGAGEIECFESTPAEWPPADLGDVVIFDGWLPDEWPEELPAIVLRPPGSRGPVRAAPIPGDGLPIDRLRAIDQEHPLLYGVASERVAVTQTAVLETSSSLAPLWVGRMGPLMVAGERDRTRIVVMAFAPEKSERLPLLASYPLLLGNAILWTTQSATSSSPGSNFRTGDVIELAGDAIEWSVPPEAPVSLPRSGELTELDRIGLWKVGETRGSAALRSRSETLLEPRVIDPDDDRLGSTGSPLRGDLRPWLLWTLLILLLVEAWLFHRRGVF